MPVSPRRRARTLGVGALLLGFFVAVVATLAQMFRDGRAHPIAPADVAVVFGAEASERVVSPEALARVERAAELYRAGLVGAIVCSGGLADGASEATVMRRLLIERGVPEDAVLADDRGSNSRLTLESVHGRALGRWRRFVLVSSPYHLHRLLAEARRRGMDAQAAPAVLSPFPWPLRTAAERRLALYKISIHAREVLAVWWYALPVRISTIETRKTAALTAESERIAALLVPVRRPDPDVPGGPTPDLARPVDAARTSGFGWRAPRHHAGVDFAANTGTPVRASSDGTVVVVEQFPMYGLVVAVAHGAGLATLYAHLSTVDVEPDDRVAAGQRVGRTGSSGNAYGPHLHFEVRLDGTPVDPARYVDLPPFVGGRPSAPGCVWILRRLRAEARRLVRRPGRRPA